MDSTLNSVLKKNCSRFPVLLLHSNHLSCRTFRTYLVLGGIHPAGRTSHLKFCYFSKNSGDVPLFKIISRDPLGWFGREYACWKGQIVSILKEPQSLIWSFSALHETIVHVHHFCPRDQMSISLLAYFRYIRVPRKLIFFEKFEMGKA
jgi:hypothetical protein